MIRSHIARGIGKAAGRRSLILLLYLVGLGVAVLLAVPVFRVVNTLFGSSGFSGELAQRFDIVLWMDMIEKGGTALAAALRQFFWAIPLFLVWKVASQVGLVYALKDDGKASFWEGVSRYTLRGLLLAVIYLLVGGASVAILWVILVAIIKGLGEPGKFWTAIVIGPVVSIVILATFDVMHDYARMRLVLRGDGIWKSFRSGSLFPIQRLSALFLYTFWFLVGGVFWLIPFWLDGALAKTTVAGMFGAFLIQQVVILTRHGVTVGWIGSEVSYFEANAEILADPTEDDSTEIPASTEMPASTEIVHDAASELPGPDSSESAGNGPEV